MDGSLRRNLKDNAIPEHAAQPRGAIQVAVSIENEVATRTCPTRTAEIVEGGVRPAAIRGCQFESRSLQVVAVAEGRAVEVTGSIHDQLVLGAVKLAVAEESVKRVKGPAAVGGCQFENRTAITVAPIRSRSVQIAGGIEDQPPGWNSSVAPPTKAMKSMLGPTRSGG